MHAPLDSLSTTFINHMQRTIMGGQQAYLCGKLMVTCEASGAREHGVDVKSAPHTKHTASRKKLA
jgi:hypothetical protein